MAKYTIKQEIINELKKIITCYNLYHSKKNQHFAFEECKAKIEFINRIKKSDLLSKRIYENTNKIK
jgi:hypothetical protein